MLTNHRRLCGIRWRYDSINLPNVLKDNVQISSQPHIHGNEYWKVYREVDGADVVSGKDLIIKIIKVLIVTRTERLKKNDPLCIAFKW